jgi:asparagine synthase (glutamine-hydrolysing)
MSAIAGIWSFDEEVPVSTACQGMLQALRIYGQDDTAQYSSRSVALGRCLLRLLPEDCFDQQPLAAAGATALVADVRLDNRDELGQALSLSKEQCAVMADSALLLAAW